VKRIIIPILIFTLLCSCSQQTNQGKTSSDNPKSSNSSQAATKVAVKEFVLPYKSASVLNPIVSDSYTNILISKLIYDSLITLDDTFTPQYKLATSVTVNGTDVSIILKGGVVFSDGTSLTANDVIYTINQAKANASSYYNTRLANVSYPTGNGNFVTIKLFSPDPYFVNLLDIPIIKAGSVADKTIIGTGRYMLLNQNNKELQINPKWWGGKKMQIQAIPLKDIPDNEAMIHGIEMGTLSCAYTDSLGQAGINANTSDVNINAMVFLGINSQKEPLSDVNVRQAVSLAINRQGIVAEAYAGHAKPCTGPFNPDFKPAATLQKGSVSSDITAAETALTQAGYSQVGNDGIRSNNGKRLTIQLLYLNNDTSKTTLTHKIISDLKLAGIEVTANEAADVTAYNNAVNSRNFDLYIGEIHLSPNMDLSPLITPQNPTATGILPNSVLLGKFNDFKSNKSDLQTFITAFETEMPFYPLCYRSGIAAYSKTLNTALHSTYSDIFNNMEDIKLR
jgi:peptide/nickel transport system substrate-binding protein